MSVLTKEEILKADDLRTETVTVPEWGGEVTVRTMPGWLRDEYDMSLVEKEEGNGAEPPQANFRTKLLVRTIVDADGERMFTSAEIDTLSRKSGAALNRVFEVARKLNPMSTSEIEELEKNSESALNDDSGSGLPENSD